jgi:hypothetical protein
MEDGTMSDLEDLSARSLAFDAVVRTAVEKAQSDYMYRRRFSSKTVLANADTEVSKRTVRRALKDAEALGWVKKKSNEWAPGRRADQLLETEK